MSIIKSHSAAAQVGHQLGRRRVLHGIEAGLAGGRDVPHHVVAEKDFLRRMKKETERIHKVLRDLLDFARPEAEGPISSTSVLSSQISEVVNDVVALLKPQKTMKAITIEVEVPSDHRARIGSSRLVQVLLNLGMNAADAMNEKGTRTRLASRLCAPMRCAVSMIVFASGGVLSVRA